MEAGELDRKQRGEDHPEYASNLHNQGALLVKLRQPRASLECFHKALSIYEAKLPANHPDTIGTLKWIAVARRMACDKDFAVRESSNQRVCENCSKVGLKGIELGTCIVCDATYCSEECQLAQWPEHQKVCEELPKDPCFVCLKGDSKVCAVCTFHGRATAFVLPYDG